MAHYETIALAQCIAQALLDSKAQSLRVLEIGSYQAYNSGMTSMRAIFSSLANVDSYIGCDLVEGPGVDFVCSGHLLEFPDENFDLIISSEVFEHNPYWKETLINMERMARPGGLVFITCASVGRLEHGTYRTNPNDSPGTTHAQWKYYHNISRSEFLGHINHVRYADMLCQYNSAQCDMYFVGAKEPFASHEDKTDLRECVKAAVLRMPSILSGDPKVSLVKKLSLKALYAPIRISQHFFNEPLGQDISVYYATRLLMPLVNLYRATLKFCMKKS